MNAARLALLAAPLLSACVARVVLEPRDLDRLLGEMGAQSVARTEHYTLWAPVDWVSLRPWLALVDEERQAVVDCFGRDASAPRVQVVLVPVEGLGPSVAQGADGTVAYAPAATDPTHGLEGWAGENGVALHVPATTYVRGANGLRLPVVSSPDNHRRTLRHELAHWRAITLAIGGGDWLEEGLAQVVEGLELEQGRFVDRGAPRVDLAAAAALGIRDLPLAALLDWREDGGRIVERVQEGEAEGDLGIEPGPRTACGLYVRFLLGLEGSGAPVAKLAERLAALERHSRAEHLAGEARWRAWLEAELARHAAAAAGG